MLDPDEIKAIQKFQGKSAQVMTLLIIASRDAFRRAEPMAQQRVEEFNELLPVVRSLMVKR